MKRILACTRGTVLFNVVERAAQISTLNAQIHLHLDPECREHVQVANYENGVLTLLVDSPSFGTKLRYETPHLLTAFRQDGLPALSNINIMLQLPSKAAEAPANRRVPECSQPAALSVAELGLSVNCPKLSTALSKLAQSIHRHSL